MHVVRCRSCGAVFQPDPNQPPFLCGQKTSDNSLETYYGKRTPDKVNKLSSQEKRRLEKLFSDLKLLAPNGQKVLDVGCGWGTGFLKMAKQHFPEVAGVEPNEVQAAYAARTIGVTVYNKPYDDGCFVDSQFDVISFIQVMEHLPDPKSVLKTANRHLKPGGVLVIEVPSFNNPRVLLYRLTRIPWFARSDFISTHLFYFTAKSISMCVRQSGFAVKALQTGNYSAKLGLGCRIGRFLDTISNRFGIGGITLFATKD